MSDEPEINRQVEQARQRIEGLSDKQTNYDFEEYREAVSSALAHGHSIIKTLLLANGGSAVATLALINSLLGKAEIATAATVLEIWPSLLFFAFGVFFSGITSWTAYMAESERAKATRRPNEHRISVEARIYRDLGDSKRSNDFESWVNEVKGKREISGVKSNYWTYAAWVSGGLSGLLFLAGIGWGVYGLRASAMLLAA